MKTILLVPAGGGTNVRSRAAQAFLNFLIKSAAAILIAFLLPAQLASAQKIDTSFATGHIQLLYAKV